MDTTAAANPPGAAGERGAGFLELWDVLRTLRGPDGCPWDKEQSLATLTPYLIEEAYEILDAVAANHADDVAEELGDTLFLVVSCADLLAESSPHTLDSLCRATAAKLRRRHPHVFGDATVKTAYASQRQWQEIKQEEQNSRSLLGKMPASLPSLTAAFRTQEKAASVGFDWPEVAQVVAHLLAEAAAAFLPGDALFEQLAGGGHRLHAGPGELLVQCCFDRGELGAGFARTGADTDRDRDAARQRHDGLAEDGAAAGCARFDAHRPPTDFEIEALFGSDFDDGALGVLTGAHLFEPRFRLAQFLHERAVDGAGGEP